MKLLSYLSPLTLVLALAPQSWAGDAIPKAAWRRPLGLPLDKAGGTGSPAISMMVIGKGHRLEDLGRALFPEATAVFCPLAHQGWRSQVRARLLEPVRNVSTK